MLKNKIKNMFAVEGGRHMAPLEYVCIILSRIGGQFGSTLTGTLAATFVYELYFGPAGVSADEIAEILAVQTTLTTLLGIGIGL